MSDLITTLRAIIREELGRQHTPELGIVTSVYAKDGDDSANNHQVNIRLRSSGIELQRAPVASGRLGFSMLPREGDLVMVAFIGGDLNAPVVLGSIYDSERQPPVGKAAELVYQPPDDGDASIRRFYLELPSGTKLTIDDDNFHIETGGTEVLIKRDGDVSVKSAGKLALEAKGDITLDASGNLQLNAQSNVTIKGQSVTMEGQSAAKVKGSTVTLAGNTSFSAA